MIFLLQLLFSLFKVCPKCHTWNSIRCEGVWVGVKLFKCKNCTYSYEIGPDKHKRRFDA